MCGQGCTLYSNLLVAEELGSVGKGLLLKRGSDSLAAGKWNCMLPIKIKKSAELWPTNPLHQAHLIDVESPLPGVRNLDIPSLTRLSQFLS